MKKSTWLITIFIILASLLGCTSKSEEVDISQINKEELVEVWEGILNGIVNKDKEITRKYLYFKMKYEDPKDPEVVLNEIVNANYAGDLTSEIIDIEIKNYKQETVFDAPGTIKVTTTLKEDSNSRNWQFNGVFDNTQGKWKMNGYSLGYWYKPSDYEE